MKSRFASLLGLLAGVGLLAQLAPLHAQPSTLDSRPASTNHVLELDGNDSWVELPADLLKDVKNELTVEGWIRWQKLGAFSRFFDFGPENKSLAVYQRADSPGLQGAIHNVGRILVMNVLQTNQWQHLALTISGQTTLIYVNGVLAASDRFNFNFDQFRAGPHRLGVSFAPDNPQGRRQMDEFRVWSVARTEEQIRQAIRAKLTGREAGLLGCWNFDAGDATDLTPAQRHGVLHGAPRFPMEAPPQPSALLVPAQIEGEIREANGQPYPFTVVTLKSAGANPMPNLLLGFPARFLFTVFNPANDVFELTAALGGCSAVRGGILLQPGQKLQLDLTLSDASSVAGTLHTFDPAMFHAVVPVQLLNASSQVVATALSDGTGRYAFTNVPPAEYQIRCQVLNGYRYLGVTNLVTYADVASADAAPLGAPASVPVGNSPAGMPALPAATRDAQRLTLLPGQKIENADFTFAPFRKILSRRYSLLQGLPDNAVRQIRFASDGAAWLGTGGGLARFDGSEFITVSRQDGLPGNGVRAIEPEADGSLWLGTERGLARYHPGKGSAPGRFSFTGDSEISNSIVEIRKAPNNILWALTDSDVRRYDLSNGNSGFKYPVVFEKLWERDRNFGAGGAEVRMATTPDGRLWLTGPGAGLVRYEGTNMLRFTEKDGLLSTNTTGVAVAPDGAIWFADGASSITRFDGTNSVHYADWEGRFSGVTVTTLYAAPNGTIWVATATLEGGTGWRTTLSRFDGKSFVYFGAAEGVPQGMIRDMRLDASGDLWVASGNSG